MTNVKLFHVYIKVHNTTSDIGHKPAISNIFNRFKMCLITSKIASAQYNLPWAIMTNLGHITGPLWKHPFLNTFINQSISILGNLHSFWRVGYNCFIIFQYYYLNIKILKFYENWNFWNFFKIFWNIEIF